MLAVLPTPLYTVVDEADLDLTSSWQQAGFTTRRREWEYLVSTDPRVTGLDSVLPPEGVRIIPVGAALQAPLSEVYSAIRDEVQANIGWDSMPAEVLARSDGTPPLDPLKYAVAAESGRYVGLVRVVPRRRQARIGLIAVRADWCRRGIARALLANVLGSLHSSAIDTAWVEVDESNSPAVALFEGVGARRVSSNLELVRR
jgi:ribosomal protein S18 acetylase RimI-like enzyme